MRISVKKKRDFLDFVPMRDFLSVYADYKKHKWNEYGVYVDSNGVPLLNDEEKEAIRSFSEDYSRIEHLEVLKILERVPSAVKVLPYFTFEIEVLIINTHFGLIEYLDELNVKTLKHFAYRDLGVLSKLFERDTSILENEKLVKELLHTQIEVLTILPQEEKFQLLALEVDIKSRQYIKRFASKAVKLYYATHS